jgi:PAS domain S-box-containing protein
MPKKDFKKEAEEGAYALALMRATLEAAADGIVATDEEGRITNWNAKFVEIFGLPEELIALRDIKKIRALIAQQLKDSSHYWTRIAEIEASNNKSSDLLELADGRLIERYSEVISVEQRPGGRAWSFRNVTERHQSELVARRLAAIVDNSDDRLLGRI